MAPGQVYREKGAGVEELAYCRDAAGNLYVVAFDLSAKNFWRLVRSVRLARNQDRIPLQLVQVGQMHDLEEQVERLYGPTHIPVMARPAHAIA